MLKAALESLKRRDTQLTREDKKPESQKPTTSPLSSQLSALLFSSSPPPRPQPTKIAKLDNFEGFYKEEEDDDDDEDEEYLENLLRDIDDEEMLKCTLDPVKESSTANFIVSPVNSSKQESFSYSLSNDSPSFNRVLDNCGVLPMIDISTPQVFSQRPPLILSSPHPVKTTSSLSKTHPTQFNQSTYSFTQSSDCKVMIPESFNLEDLRHNIKTIHESLHLSPIEAIKRSNDRRVTFPLALMVRDFRQIGSMAQVRFLDAEANEIIGSLPFSACSELGIKLHFGLLFVLINVSLFSPVPGVKYLNITRANIQNFIYNVSEIK